MKASRSIALVLLLLTATFFFPTTVALSQSMFTVRGQVVDVTGGLVPSAIVRLYSAQGILDQRTDGDGRFQFTNVPKGIHELEGASTAFIPGTVDFEIDGKTPDPFKITLGVGQGGGCSVQQNDADRIVAWLGTSVAYEKRYDKVDVTGVERDQFGSPLPAVMVKLTRAGVSREVMSSGKGEFTFSGLDPGKYSLQSTRAGYHDLPTIVWITRENIVKIVFTLVESWRFCGG
jgi:hypothetical protein